MAPAGWIAPATDPLHHCNPNDVDWCIDIIRGCAELMIAEVKCGFIISLKRRMLSRMILYAEIKLSDARCHA